jgi:hypothetical protein
MNDKNPTKVVCHLRALRSPTQPPVCTENLNPDIVVMKPAKDRV